MTTEFIDGFDHYADQTNFYRKYDPSSGYPRFSTGRFGAGQSLYFVASDNAKLMALPNLATRVIGFAYQCASSSGGLAPLVLIMDGTSEQIDIRFSPVAAPGPLVVTRNGTVLGSSSINLSVGTWYYIELMFTIDPTVGAVTLRVNGTAVLTLTGINTRNTANSYCNGIWLQGVAANSYYDDYYVLNTSGTYNNTFLGDCRVYTVLPSGDGGTVQWTPSAGTSHFANVNDASPNDDTNYNSSLTVGQYDLLTYPAISPTGAILAIQSVICARKDDTGVRTLCDQCKSGATLDSGVVVMTLASTYAMSRQIREVDPNTAAPWVLANLNAAQFGYKLLS